MAIPKYATIQYTLPFKVKQPNTRTYLNNKLLLVPTLETTAMRMLLGGLRQGTVGSFVHMYLYFDHDNHYKNYPKKLQRFTINFEILKT